MASSITQRSFADTGENPLGLQVVEAHFVSTGTGSQTLETPFVVAGVVDRVELYCSPTIDDAATIKGYESDAYGAVGSRGDFLAYTKSGAGALSAQIYPTIQRTDIGGGAVSAEYAPPVVGGKLTFAIAGVTATREVLIRTYIRD